MLDKSTKTMTLERAADSFFTFTVRSNATQDRNEFKLIVKGLFTLEAQRDPDDPRKLYFHFTEQHAQSLGKNPREYQIVRTQGDLSRVYLRGAIQAAGFGA